MQRPLDIKNRPRIPIPDEDPYSIAGNGDGSGGSSGSSGFGTSNNVSGVYTNAFYSKLNKIVLFFVFFFSSFSIQNQLEQMPNVEKT